MDLTSLLHAASGPWTYAVVALLAALESAAFVGLLVPGETVMLLAGVLASTGRVDLVGMVLAASVGAVAGDQAGYALGRALGPSLREGRLGRRVGYDRWAAAEDLVSRRGGPAVFLGRWIGFLRAVVPAAAGAIGVPRTVFLAWNAVGGVLWATSVVGAGFLAGASWPRVQHALGVGALLGGTAVALVVGLVMWRRRRTEAPLDPWRPGRVAVAVGWGGAVALAVAVGELSDEVADHTGVTGFDPAVLAWVLGHRSPGLTVGAEVIGVVAGDLAMAALGLLVVAVLAHRRRWREARLVAAVTLGAGALVEVLKPVVDRPRPPASVQLAVETNASFPSGHTVLATAVLGVLAALLARRSGSAAVRAVLPSV